MHIHEFEHIIGLIASIEKENKVSFDDYTLYPLKIINGNSLSLNEERIEYTFFSQKYYLLEDYLENFDFNRILNYRVYQLDNKGKNYNVIIPIDHYLRNEEKYYTVQMSAGPFGCIPIAGANLINKPKCIQTDDNKWYVKFENAGLKHEENAKEEEEADLYVKINDKTDPFCKQIEDCLNDKTKKIEGAIFGKRKIWPFWKKSRAHKKVKLKIGGKEAEEWVIKSKKVNLKCVKKE